VLVFAKHRRAHDDDSAFDEPTNPFDPFLG
jgi:hypothetical protein